MKIIIIICGLLATALSQTTYSLNMSTEVLHDNFNIFDKNGDGIIHMSEVFDAFRRIDQNDDGQLSLKEFTYWGNPDQPPLQTQIFFDFMDNLDSTVNGVVESTITCTYFSLLDADNNRKAIFGEYRNASQKIHDHIKKEVKNIAGC